MKKREIMVGVIIAGLLAGPARAETVTLSGMSQMEDTYLRGDNLQTSASYNYGGANLLIVGASTNAAVIANSLMRFTDFSAVSGRTVTSATLRLYNNNNAGQTADVTIHVYEVAAANGDWVEGTSLGVTVTGVSDWRFKIQNTGFWAGGTGSGCGVAGTDYTTNLVGRAVSTNTMAEYINIALDASVVQKWIDNPSQNYGILLTAVGAAPGQIAYFNSSENTIGLPQLVLEVGAQKTALGLYVIGFLN